MIYDYLTFILYQMFRNISFYRKSAFFHIFYQTFTILFYCIY